MWPKHLIHWLCAWNLSNHSLHKLLVCTNINQCFQIDQYNDLEKYIDQAGRLGWRKFPRTDWMCRRSKVALFLTLNFIDKWQNFIGLSHYTALLKRFVLEFIWSLSRSRTGNVISTKFSINFLPNRNLELKLPIISLSLITSNLVAALRNQLQVVCNVQLSQTTRVFRLPSKTPTKRLKVESPRRKPGEELWMTTLQLESASLGFSKPKRWDSGGQVDGGWHENCLGFLEDK